MTLSGMVLFLCKIIAEGIVHRNGKTEENSRRRDAEARFEQSVAKRELGALVGARIGRAGGAPKARRGRGPRSMAASRLRADAASRRSRGLLHERVVVGA